MVKSWGYDYASFSNIRFRLIDNLKGNGRVINKDCSPSVGGGGVKNYIRVVESLNDSIPFIKGDFLENDYVNILSFHQGDQFLYHSR